MFCAHLLTHRTKYYNHPPNQKTEEGGGWGGEVSRGEDRVEKSKEEERREGREQKRTGTKEAHSSLRLVVYWVSNTVNKFIFSGTDGNTSRPQP